MRALAGLAALALLASCGDGGAASGPPTTAPPVRIIPVNGDLAEVVYALGLGDQVVATDISATYPPEADATPKIGYQRTLVAETILSFDPTIVLADDLAGPPEVLEQLDDAGVEVVRVDRQTTLDAPAAKIRAVATALDVPERGEQLVAALEADLASAAERASAAVATDGRPKVLALYLRGESVQLAFGAGSGIDAVIDAAGGADLGTAMGVVDNAELSTESVVAAAPDILLVTTSGLESVGGVDGLVAIPGIDQTPAAQQRRVVAFEDQYLYGLGPRTGQLVGELVDAFHTPDWRPTMRMLTTMTIAAALALAACGDDDDAAADTTTTTAAPVATAVAAGSYVPGADPDADAAAEAWTAAFDSTTGFDDKAAFIADAEALRATIEAYTPAGGAVGGIALVPTAIVITGDTAAITYDVTFAGQPAYQDQEGTVERVDGAWVVSRDEFCGFMAAARNPCA